MCTYVTAEAGVVVSSTSRHNPMFASCAAGAQSTHVIARSWLYPAAFETSKRSKHEDAGGLIEQEDRTWASVLFLPRQLAWSFLLSSGCSQSSCHHKQFVRKIVAQNHHRPSIDCDCCMLTPQSYDRNISTASAAAAPLSKDTSKHEQENSQKNSRKSARKTDDEPSSVPGRERRRGVHVEICVPTPGERDVMQIHQFTLFLGYLCD